MNDEIQKILIDCFDDGIARYNKIETFEAFGTPNDINLSSILDRLITGAGRFCQRFASDLFISWNGILNYIQNRPNHDKRRIIMLATRRNGVDGDDFILCNLENIEKYAEIFLINIEDDAIDGNISVSMKTGAGVSWFPANKIKNAKNAE